MKPGDKFDTLYYLEPDDLIKSVPTQDLIAELYRRSRACLISVLEPDARNLCTLNQAWRGTWNDRHEIAKILRAAQQNQSNGGDIVFKIE